MKRRSKFAIALLTAVLTFGGLTALNGPPRFHSCHPHHAMHDACGNHADSHSAPSSGGEKDSQ
jgi:hypothetical protein